MTCDYFCNAHIYVQIWVIIIVVTSVLAGIARTESQSHCKVQYLDNRYASELLPQL